jgi:hypothetical protein
MIGVKETATENTVGDRTVFTFERHGGPASSDQALIDTNTGMEMLEIAEKHLLGNKVEVTKYLINDENMKNCADIDIKIGNGNVKGVIDTGSEISLITEDLSAHLLSQGVETLGVKITKLVLITGSGSMSRRIKNKCILYFTSVMNVLNVFFLFLVN